MRGLPLLACVASATCGGRLPARLLPPRLRSAACGKPARGRRFMRLPPTHDRTSALPGQSATWRCPKQIRPKRSKIDASFLRNNHQHRSQAND
ncbi:hypothetical protein BHE74_00014083 [Ensete ventricosum]|nr:hypothetical protein BHE74_00014083 [Ensete ventricosum]